MAKEDLGLSLNQLLRQAQIAWHGVKLNQPDWGPDARSLAFTMRSLRGRFLLHGILNAYWEPLDFDLPPVTEGPDRQWRRCIDTALDSPQDICEPAESPAVREATYLAQPRSIVILLARIGA